MTYLHLFHLAATAGFCVLLWMVQVVVYPQMVKVRAEDFHAYHERHTHAITWLVAPLFLLEGSCAALSFWLGWQSQLWGQVASVGLFAANSLVTFLWFVPAHLRLGRGRNEILLQRLVAMNWLRTGLSTVRVLVVMDLAAQKSFLVLGS
ncbi:MAG: hypothetical protein V4727_11345 [Verrucomicrobiota bacterium]